MSTPESSTRQVLIELRHHLDAIRQLGGVAQQHADAVLALVLQFGEAALISLEEANATARQMLDQARSSGALAAQGIESAAEARRSTEDAYAQTKKVIEELVARTDELRAAREALQVTVPLAKERVDLRTRRRQRLDMVRPRRSLLTAAHHRKFNDLLKAGISVGEAREAIAEAIQVETGIRRSPNSLRRQLKRSRTKKK